MFATIRPALRWGWDLGLGLSYGCTVILRDHVVVIVIDSPIREKRTMTHALVRLAALYLRIRRSYLVCINVYSSCTSPASSIAPFSLDRKSTFASITSLYSSVSRSLSVVSAVLDSVKLAIWASSSAILSRYGERAGVSRMMDRIGS